MLVFAALLGTTSWLVPNHYLPWTSFHAEVVMALAFMLATLAGLLRGGWSFSQIRPLALAIAALSLLPMLQALLGQVAFFGDAWVCSGYLLAFALALWLGQAFAQQYGRAAAFEGIAGIFVAASLLSMALALCQWLSLRPLGALTVDLPPAGRPFANLGQPNHLSTLLFLGLAAALYLRERGRLSTAVAALLCIYLEFGMAMTTSRTAWLAMGALLPLLWVLRVRAGLRTSRIEIAALGAIFVGWLLVWPVLSDALLLSGGRDFVMQSAASPRMILWSTAVDAISQQPWFGYGWNQSQVAQSRVLLEHHSGGRLMGSAHNLALDLMLWCGIPLTVAIIGGLSTWGWRRLQVARTPDAVLLLAALAGVLAHAMVELPLSFLYFLLPAGMMMGLLDGLPPARRSIRVHAGWIGGAAFAAGALLVLIALDYMKVEDNLRTLRFEVARIGTGRIESQAPDLLVLSQWAEFLRAARIEGHEAMPAQELAWMTHVAERFPYARLQFEIARAQGLNGQPAAAAVTLRRLCALHSPRQCRELLAEWREQAQTEHPVLATVTVPARP